MIFYYLDASAWVKRYYDETGTAWVQDLFARGPAIACATLGVVEVTAALARKHKAGEVDTGTLHEKMQEVEEDWEGFIQIQLAPEVVDRGRELAKRVALRGADAIHLASASLLQERLEEEDRLILVASDQELIQAAQSVGLAVANPEEQDRYRLEEMPDETN